MLAFPILINAWNFLIKTSKFHLFFKKKTSLLFKINYLKGILPSWTMLEIRMSSLEIYVLMYRYTSDGNSSESCWIVSFHKHQVDCWKLIINNLGIYPARKVAQDSCPEIIWPMTQNRLKLIQMTRERSYRSPDEKAKRELKSFIKIKLDCIKEISGPTVANLMSMQSPEKGQESNCTFLSWFTCNYHSKYNIYRRSFAFGFCWHILGCSGGMERLQIENQVMYFSKTPIHNLNYTRYH